MRAERDSKAGAGRGEGRGGEGRKGEERGGEERVLGKQKRRQ